VKIEQDIAIFENYFNDEYCDNVIDWFNLKSVVADHEKTVDRDDFTISEPHIIFGSFKSEFYNTLVDKLKQAYLSYRKNYDFLLPAELIMNSFKIQKSIEGGGFCTWHWEHDPYSNPNRFLVWMLYLNDVANGGKTEFRNGLKVQPKKGTLVLWPAYFTHMHRAAPDLKETKYIMTGWYEYRPTELKDN